MPVLQERTHHRRPTSIDSIVDSIPPRSEDEPRHQSGEQTPLLFEAGQHVIWLYRTSRHHFYRIAAEVVQMGLLRARIRSTTSDGKPILRWVKPSNLRLRELDEQPDPYPSSIGGAGTNPH